MIMQTKQMWYSDNADRTSSDFIHQTLMYGQLEDIRELKVSLGEEKLREAFLNHPKKIYTNAALNFVKKFILHIGSSIDEQQYLKYTSRNIRQ
jgi:hypothetical protein